MRYIAYLIIRPGGGDTSHLIFGYIDWIFEKFELCHPYLFKMGIKSQGKVLWKASPIQPIHLKVMVANGMRQRKSPDGSSDDIKLM